MKTGSERQAWLDYVRFFSIFLVVVVHTPPRLILFDDGVVFNLHIPVFFCISGFLYSFDRWPRFTTYLRHRAQQIIVPYCTFFVIFYALWLAVGRRMVGAEEEAISVWQPVVEFVCGNPQTVVAPFWYIACLFTMQLLYWCIERTVPRRYVFATCVGIATGTYLIPFEIPEVLAVGKFWNLGNALLFLPVYALGNNFKLWLTRLTLGTPHIALLLVVMAMVSIVIMVEATIHRSADPQLYCIVRTFAAIMVIPCYLGVAKWFATKFGYQRVIEFVAMSGIVYLGVQNYFIGIAKILLSHFFYNGVTDEHILFKFTIAIMVMIAIYPFAWAIDRYAPWLIGKKKKQS